MDVTLNPLTFTFSNDEIERAFISYQSEEHLRVERTYILFDTILAVAFELSDRFPEGWMLRGLAFALLGLYQLFYYALTQRDISVRIRFWIRFAIRCLRVFIFKVISPLWIVPSISESFLGAAILRSGVTLLFWDGIGWQTRFREFFLLQGIFTLVLQSTLSRSVCQGVFQKLDSENIAMQLWKSLQTLSNQLIGYEWACFLFENTTPIDACVTVIAFAHALISFALPIVILWIAEIRSRCEFLELLSRNGTWMGFRLRNLWKSMVYFYSGTKSLPVCFSLRACLGIVIITLLSRPLRISRVFCS